MKLLVIGASGRLGRELVMQGMEQGHAVTAFLRRPSDELGNLPGLNVVRGDLLDAASLEPAVAGQDVVLASAGPGVKFRQKTTLYSQGANNLKSVMVRHGVKRLIWTTSSGVNTKDPAVNAFVFKWIIKPLLLSGIYADASLSEQILRDTPLDWIFIHPTRLTDGPRTGSYRVDPLLTPQGGREISRADVAEFMLRQVADDQFLRTTPALAY